MKCTDPEMGRLSLIIGGLDYGGVAKLHKLLKAENCILTGVRESDG